MAEKVNVERTVAVQPLQDQRGADPYVLSYKGVGMKTRGTYVTDAPIVTIVTDAIRDTLLALNYKITASEPDLVLSGELLRLDSTPLMGFWSGALDCTIQVNLKLFEQSTGRQIWSEVFTGFNKKTGLQVDHEGHRKDTTEAALADLAQKIANSSTFKNAVQSYKRE